MSEEWRELALFFRKKKIRIKRIMRRLNPKGKQYKEHMYKLANLSNIKKACRKLEMKI